MTQHKLQIKLIGCRLLYPLYVSGADIFNVDVALYLQEKGHDIEFLHAYIPELDSYIKKRLKALDCDYSEDELGFHFHYKGLAMHLYKRDCFHQTVSETMAQNPAAIYWHQQPTLEGFDFDRVFNPNLKNIVFMHSSASVSFFEPYKETLTAIFANSTFCQTQIKARYNQDAEIVLPLPTEACISTKTEKEGQYITFINPAKIKGLDIVEELIKRNPHRAFVIVYAWWSSLPDSFKNYDNVAVVPSQLDVSELYNMSRLMLVPTQCDEYFGRVQFEAAWNTVPVCISNKGALPDYFKGNGVLVDDYQRVEAWQSAIERLDDETVYQDAQKQCLKIKENYSFESEAQKFEALLQLL